jgi:tetratricopeptide (TPR) repeat protein
MHPSRISASIGVVLALLLPSGLMDSSAVHAQATNIALTQALDRYEQGDRAVLLAIAQINNGTALLLNLEKYGPKWAKAKGVAKTPRRLLVMATFALEAAGNSSVPTTTALQLTEFACDRLRPPNGPAQPLPAERLWHQAALGVLEAKGNYMAVQAHLWHLNRRFKDEPRALLARAWVKQSEWEAIPGEVSSISMPFDIIVPRDLRAHYGSFVYQSMVNLGFAPAVYGTRGLGLAGLFLPGRYAMNASGTFGAPRDITSSIWSKPEEKVKVAGRVIHEYEKALAEPSVAPEAYLRLGYLYYVSGKPELARLNLAEAQRRNTALDQLYLIELFRGWLEEREGRMEEAEAAYRRALVHVPYGRTAVTWLATLMQGGGSLDDAQSLIDASLAARDKIPDPWPLFAQGDYRHWASTMDKLRGELWAGAPPRSR